MTLDESQREAWLRKQHRHGDRRGGSGGGDDGLEARIAKLEAHVEHVRDDLGRLSDMPLKLAVLDERVGHLPTKGWMAASLGTSLAIIAALMTFEEKLRALIH